MRIKNVYLLASVFALSAVLAFSGLSSRLGFERSNKTVAFVAEYNDIAGLADQGGKSIADEWDDVHRLGVEGLTVYEYTGNDIITLHPMGIDFMSASMAGVSIAPRDLNTGVLTIAKDSPYADRLLKYLKLKMPGVSSVVKDDKLVVVLNSHVDDFINSAIVPAFEALDFCRANKVSALYRPGMCVTANGAGTAAAIDYVHQLCPEVRNIIPAGLVMAGFPDLQPLADTLKKDGISLSLTEFVKQIGVGKFSALMYPDDIPLHSLTQDEIISKNVTRKQMSDRFVRAVHERSVRFIIMRPYDLQMGDRTGVFLEDLAAVKSELEARGYSFGWPSTPSGWTGPAAGALACALMFIFCLWSYAGRMVESADDASGIKQCAVLFAASLAVAAAIWKVPFAARLFGGFCGGMIATEAALTALDSRGRHLLSAIFALLTVLAGGLAIASFYGSAKAVLRITPFSGVKLTLLLPPLLILLYDFKRRVHPESVSEIMARSSLWGELAVVGAMMAALLIVALRSDNVSSVPGWEVAFRNFMERLMVVRPRTKEFLVGYPALVLYWFVRKHDWMPHYREVLRVAASLAFCSAVDTFCHFHTMLSLSVIRVLNGWWLGIVLGFVAVAALSIVGMPLWRRYFRRLFD